MSSINKTPHYNLSQFGDSPDDKPSWRGDYTGDMSKIDSQMYRNETDATTATSTANTAKTTADNALSLVQTNKADIAEQESYFTALGVTSAQTAQALMSTINGKAENTALTALQGTVSTLSDTVDGKADAANVYTKAQSDTTFTKQGGYSGTAETLDSRISANASQISATSSTLEAVRKNGINPIDVYHSIDEVYGAKIDYHAYYSPIAKLVTLRVTITGTATNWGVGLNPAEQALPSQYRPAGALRQLLAVFIGAGNTVPAHLLFGVKSDGYPFVDQAGPNTTTQTNMNISAVLSYFITE